MRITLLLFLCFLFPSAPAAVKNAGKAYEKALAAYQKNDIKTATMRVAEALTIDSTIGRAYLLKAELLAEMQSWLLAKEAYRHFVRLSPDLFPEALLTLAYLEFDDREYNACQTHATQYLLRDSTTTHNRTEARKLITNARFADYSVKNPVSCRPEKVLIPTTDSMDIYRPGLSADESMLVFTALIRNKQTGQTTAGTLQEDLYYSQRFNGVWGKAMPFKNPLNTSENEGAQTLSSDGNIMIFTGCNRHDGLGMCDLYYSVRTTSGWSTPQNLGAPVNSPHKETQPSLSSDGNTLYFASNRPGGKGGLDIWCSTLTDRKWSLPQNLTSVNTSGDELAPFIHADDQTLYFSSNGWPGMGNQDLMLSHRQSDGTWEEPTNLGYPVNSGGDEEGLIVNATGSVGYFSSDGAGLLSGKANRGLRKIYSFVLPSGVRPHPKSEPIITFPPSVPTDSTSAQKTAAALERITLISGALSSLLTFRSIHFSFNSYEVPDSAEAELMVVVNYLRSHPTTHIRIIGHTDNAGSEAYNVSLSQSRARTVGQYLLMHGIASGRIIYHGLGTSKPLRPNDTEQNRGLNRRTEFYILLQ